MSIIDDLIWIKKEMSFHAFLNKNVFIDPDINNIQLQLANTTLALKYVYIVHII